MGLHVSGAGQSKEMFVTKQAGGSEEPPKERTVAEEIQRAAMDTHTKTKYPTDLQSQVDGMNKLLEAEYTSLKFNVHEDLDRIYVQVLNRDTDEIVREIPPEKFLDMIASFMDQLGLLVDEKI
ncbi:flagellar protein FlaG [Alteribacillus sp. HJP-4]|uniref:flagellar protein FlaG n=1 Tax=Alteribacillus sp. HJP-4 TaxID=2775394 RepID=UPI0035CCCBE3